MIEIPQVQELVFWDGERPVTDTLILAMMFGKRHSTVLRAYDSLKLRCADEFMQRNFAEHESLDKRGNPRRRVTMTEDGFIMLAMNFSGRKAMVAMGAYLGAFHAMTQHIANQVYRALLENFSPQLICKRKLH